MKRRNFMKGLMGASIAVGGNFFRIPLASASHVGSGVPTLIVIFQRGGCDGLNTVVPFGDPEYYNLRPTIGIPQPNLGDSTSALDLNGFFGLHPSLSSFIPIYSAGDMAVLPTVQYQNSSRSHFKSQDYIESGAPQTGIDGWLNRHLQSNTGGTELRAVHFGSTLSKSLRGSIPVQSFSFIDSFNSGLNSTDEANLISRVLPVYNESPSPVTSQRQLVHDYGRLVFNNLNIVAGINTSSYIPANNAVYPSGSYGRRLKETAQLIKEGVGLEVATIDIGGWDTHSNQGGGDPSGNQARRFNEFSSGISALYTDLGNLMENVIILTMTEFGRTAKENGSGGTDHGNAGSWFVIGKNIKGGILGDWPGLSESQLANGRYLQYTVDYRDIMGDILVNHMGHSTSDLSTLLPGHTYSPMNLIV